MHRLRVVNKGFTYQLKPHDKSYSKVYLAMSIGLVVILTTLVAEGLRFESGGALLLYLVLW
jgi:hypothetical protein